jgi:hypothetical protein
VEESKVRKRADAEATRENFEFDGKNAHLKNPPHGTVSREKSLRILSTWEK